jgi:hypothetical protein
LTAGANGFKKALITTGIGALVVAVGLLVAYWDEIMALVGGVSGEQKKLNESNIKDLDAQKEKLDAIDGQTNQLKLQGKSEAEILQLKIAQTDEAIQAAEINLQNAEATKQAQVAAAQRNKDILAGLLKFMSLPLTAILRSVDMISKGLKAIGVLEESTNLLDESTNYLASFVFDPEAVGEAGDATIKEAQAGLDRLKEQRAGFTLSQQEADKAAGEKSAAEREKQTKLEEEAFAILQEAKNKMLDKQKQEEIAINASYAEKQKKLAEAKIMDDGSLEAARQEELKAVQEKYTKEETERAEAAQKQLNEIITATRLAGIQDENERARAQMMIDFQTRREEITNNLKLESDERIAQLSALAIQEDQALKANQQVIDEANAIVALEKLDAEFKAADDDIALQQMILDTKLAALKQFNIDGDIVNQEFFAKEKEIADAQIALNEKKYALQISQAQEVSDTLGKLADLAGRQTAAGKALGISQALINTYVGVSAALKEESVLPSPFDVVAKIANVATVLATGLKAVKAITAVQVPGGGGGGGVSAPSISATAPSTAQVPTIGNSPITSLGAAMQPTQPLRAYVVESEVTGSQKRVADIERRAGF